VSPPPDCRLRNRVSLVLACPSGSHTCRTLAGLYWDVPRLRGLPRLTRTNADLRDLVVLKLLMLLG
jgi:hypothetical protein